MKDEKYKYVFTTETLFMRTTKTNNDDYYFRFDGINKVFGPECCYDCNGTIDYHYLVNVDCENLFYGETLGEALYNFYMTGGSIDFELYFRINDRFKPIENYIDSPEMLDEYLKKYPLYQYRENMYSDEMQMVNLGYAYNEILDHRGPDLND